MSLFDNDNDVLMPPPPALPAAPVDGNDEEVASIDESPSRLSTPASMSEPPPSTADSTVSTASPIETPTSSNSPTPPPTKAGPSKKKKKAPLPVQLIGDLPIARDEALSTFRQLQANWYQSQRMGLSRETLESMNCDCTFKPGAFLPFLAASVV